MPWVRSRYPDDWLTIRARILRRAERRCEFKMRDGRRCNVPDATMVWRSTFDKEHWSTVNEGQPTDAYLVRIVLTVAHLNHDTTDSRDENLLAGCQLHHLRHDAALHRAHAAVTRRARLGNASLPFGDPAPPKR